MRAPINGLPRSGTPRLPPPPEHPPLASARAERTVSGASWRLRALASLSGSLTDALSPQDAADLVEQKALSALDATSAVVVTLGSFPPATEPSDGELPGSDSTTLHVVHAIGLPAEVNAALEALPLDAPVPFAEVARLGEPLFLPSEQDLHRYPEWSSAVIAAGARAAAIVPVWANGELRGVLGLTWAEPRAFDEDERAFVLTLGVMCAQAIMRAHLRDAEKRAREAAELARVTAEEANRSKAQFVATISHELRTPMNAVLGYTEMLADEVYGPVNPLQKDHLARVRDTSKHLLGLIQDLLGYARIEAGEEVVRAEHALLSDVVGSSLVLVRPIAERKGLQIRVEIPDEPVPLYTDTRKLRQILVNLLGNAVKFTEAGDVGLVACVYGQGPEITVSLEVTDSGRGISPADQARVFDPFWQAEPASTRGEGGTGLGLSVARKLARLVGGDLNVTRSALGQGSTFVVSVPARYVMGATPRR